MRARGLTLVIPNEPTAEITAAVHLARARGSVRNAVRLPTLRVVSGPDIFRFHALYPDETITIGRDASADLRLTDLSVSRKHARIRRDRQAGLLVEDLGSSNGTAHNGARVIRQARALPGDTIDLGAVTLRVDELDLDEIAHLQRASERLRQANKDALTGLLTRHWMDEDLPVLAERHRITERPLAAVFVDVDRFKRVNDTHGHLVGDEVLRSVARLTALQVRESDVCLRYGGEELLCVLPACDEAGAVAMAERIRAAVASHEWGRYAPGLRVTASFGVAVLQPPEPVRDWLGRADQALYRAKSAGRNRVMAYSVGA